MAGILLVHGAWHGPWCWEGMAERLRRRGHHHVQDVEGGGGPVRRAAAAGWSCFEAELLITEVSRCQG